MTIKEICELVGCSDRTVRRKIKELFPSLLKDKSKTILQKDEALLVVGELKATIKKQIQYRQNAEDVRQNADLTSKNYKVNNQDLSIMFMAFMQQQQETNKILLTMLQNIQPQPKQIELKQDYYSIMGYANFKKQQVTFSDALSLGKQAVRLSNELGLEVRKIPDERFGFVNSYNITVLEKIFTF